MSEIQSKAEIINRNGDNYIVEAQDENGFFFGFKLKNIKPLFSKQSEFQKVEVYASTNHGNILFNDNLTMVSERDEFAYHEMIAHVPLFTHDNPKKVLVIGGGDGGTAREVLRHKAVEKCVMVEIDKAVVDACIEHIPVTASELTTNPRLELKIEDAVKYVAETQEKFDVILVDSTDPIGPAAPLFGPEFYNNIKKVLNEDGIVVSQGESGWYESKMQKVLISLLSDRFKTTKLYNFSNLTYPGGLWSFTYASNKYDPLSFDDAKVKASGLSFQYYNKDIHKAAFCLPEFMKKQLAGLLS